VIGEEKTIADGPFGKDPVIRGYFVVSALSLEQATDLAKCPVLQSGGTVEVRPLMPTD
jgi:hypothetical protein